MRLRPVSPSGSVGSRGQAGDKERFTVRASPVPGGADQVENSYRPTSPSDPFTVANESARQDRARRLSGQSAGSGSGLGASPSSRHAWRAQDRMGDRLAGGPSSPLGASIDRQRQQQGRGGAYGLGDSIRSAGSVEDRSSITAPPSAPRQHNPLGGISRILARKALAVVRLGSERVAGAVLRLGERTREELATDVRTVEHELGRARHEVAGAPTDADLGAAVLQRSLQHAQQVLHATQQETAS